MRNPLAVVAGWFAAPRPWLDVPPDPEPVSVFRVAPAPERVAPAPEPKADRRFIPPEGLFDASLQLTPKQRVELAAKGGKPAGLAPWPMTDRFPIVIGANVSLQYLSNVARLALAGYRVQLVDLLDELLEYDPHAFAVLSQRILAVAGGRIEIVPVECEDETEQEIADEVAEMVEARITAIPDLKAALARLMWGDYYAISAEEIHYRRDDIGEWWVDHVSMVHSRRLGYPDAGRWDLHILDQGMTGWLDFGTSPTSANGVGLRVDDYPGKFIVHRAQVRGDYPTREGLGRQIAGWMLLKRIAAKGAAGYLERFGKPWPFASYSTGSQGNPRSASDEDIAAAKATMAAMAAGTLSSATLPDSIAVALKSPEGPSALITYEAFFQLCNAEITKAVRGQTLTTEVSTTGGNRALGEVHERGELMIARYCADCLADELRRDLVAPLVKLNRPGLERFTPSFVIHVEDEPAPEAIMSLATAAVAMGMPLDADDLASRVDLKLVAQDEDDAAATSDEKPKARRLALVKPVELSAIDEEIEPPAPPTPPPGAPGSGVQTPAQPAPKPAEAPADEKPKAASDHVAEALPSFAERHAALLADLKDMRALGMRVDDELVSKLVALHDLPPNISSLNGESTH